MINVKSSLHKLTIVSKSI